MSEFLKRLGLNEGPYTSHEFPPPYPCPRVTLRQSRNVPAEKISGSAPARIAALEGPCCALKGERLVWGGCGGCLVRGFFLFICFGGLVVFFFLNHDFWSPQRSRSNAAKPEVQTY